MGEQCNAALDDRNTGGGPSTSAHLPKGFRWAKQCPGSPQELLRPTSQPNIDYCSLCERHVHTIGSMAELKEQLSLQNCVQFSADLFLEAAGKVKGQTPKVAGMASELTKINGRKKKRDQYNRRFKAGTSTGTRTASQIAYEDAFV